MGFMTLWLRVLLRKTVITEQNDAPYLALLQGSTCDLLHHPFSWFFNIAELLCEEAQDIYVSIDDLTEF